MAQKWTSIKEPWTIADIGAPLLDTVASGLYDALEILREYSQNAIDSYVDYAKLTGGQSPLRTVQIRIDPENAAVFVLDNGVGMDRSDVLNAKKIAVSPKLKRSQDFIGFRGIGIWSGLAACDRLEITTSKVDDPHEYKLEIDCKGIVEHFEEPISVDQLLKDRFDIYERDADADQHFTNVKLVNVHRGRYGDLLDKQKVMKYIGQTLPVPFDPAWEHSEELMALLKTVPWNQTWDITVDGDPVYRRFAAGLKKPTLETLSIKDGNQTREIGTAWVAETNSTANKKQLDPDADRGEVSGFAVRLKSVTLSDRNLYLDDSVEDRDYIDWYAGEIYLTDPLLRPDSNRRAFQQSDQSRDAIQAIRQFYSKVATRARGWSAQVIVRKAADDLRGILAEVEKELNIQPGQKNLKSPSVKHGKETINTLAAAWRTASEAGVRIAEARKKIAEKTSVKEEGLGEAAIKRYLRETEVKELMTTAEGHLERIQALLKQNVPEALKQADSGKSAKSKKPKRSRRPRAERKQQNGDDNESGLVDLETAKVAFLAAAAAVVGPNSDAYRRISARLDEELRRRGIAVKAA